MIGATVDPLEPVAIVGWIVVAVALGVHVRRRHRRLRRHRPAFDPGSTHAFAPGVGDLHVCTCGRELSHDVHHRQGGVG